QAHVHGVDLAEPAHQQRSRAELLPQEVEPRLLEDADDRAEEDVDLGAPLLQRVVDAEEAQPELEERPGDEAADENEERNNESFHQRFTSRMTWRALP